MQIKGVILHARKEFVRDHFGEEAWEKVLAALPEEERLVLSENFLTARWYPFNVGEHLDRAIVDVLGDGSNRIFEEIGVKSAQRNLKKEHRTFITPGDPQAFMKKAGIIYKFYYDKGRREYEETGPTSGVITTYEAETYSAPDCLTVIGWYKEALRMCGAKEVRAHEEECRAKGGRCCRYRFEWEM
jgi:uncharacterized protein (TIGR02265 family)